VSLRSEFLRNTPVLKDEKIMHYIHIYTHTHTHNLLIRKEKVLEFLESQREYYKGK